MRRLARLIYWLGDRRLVQWAVSPLTKSGGWLDFTGGPTAGGAGISIDELEGYPECQHDVSVYDKCEQCGTLKSDERWHHTHDIVTGEKAPCVGRRRDEPSV